MKLALMQPYFFPYLGYYGVMKHVDKYIYLDNVQYIKGGWINRNRVLKTGGGWQYIHVPIHKFKSTDAINEITIANDEQWKEKIISQLQLYKKAPYFQKVMEVIYGLFEKDYEFISELNIEADRLICQYLNISTPTSILSKMDLNYETPKASDEWGLNVCKAVGHITEYWNAPGGKKFFDIQKYKNAGIEVKFYQQGLPEYNQIIGEESFVKGLSILDVIMFNSSAKISEMLEKFSWA